MAASDDYVKAQMSQRQMRKALDEVVSGNAASAPILPDENMWPELIEEGYDEPVGY